MKYISRNKEKIYFITGIIILLFLGFNLCAHIKDFIDIDLNDEGNYLLAGKNIMMCGSRIVYPLWYKFIQLFESNNIKTYYLNQQLNIVLLPICLYLLLYTYFRKVVYSLFFSILFLYSNSNVSTEYILNDFTFCWAMKLNNFTLGLICLFGIGIYFLKKKGFTTISLFTFSFLILSYCRNEYCLLFLISILLYAFYYLFKLRNDKKETIIFAFILILSFILIKKLGLSIFATEHSYLAYAQGYTRNYLQMKQLPLFPIIDFYSESNKVFGNAKSIADFFFSNPLAFIKNSIFNLFNMLIINSYRVSDVLLPQVFIDYKDKSIANYITSWLIIIPVCIYIIKKINFKSNFQNPILLFLVVSTLPTILYCVLYVFEPRYFIFFAPLIYLSIAHILIHIKYNKIIECILTIIILIIVIYHPNTDEYIKRNKYHVDRRVISSINIIEKYKKDSRKPFIKILSNDGDFNKFIPQSSCLNIANNDAHENKKLESNINFVDFDVIILTEKQEFFYQNELYRKTIEYINKNSNYNKVVDVKKNVNLYLKK